jgi:DNA polymerase-4
MAHYAEVARQVRDVLFSFTPLVEPLSLDEAFLDVRGSEHLFGPAPAIARQVKDRVRRETGLVASVGVAANKFLAKLAGDLGKPDGLVVLGPEGVRAFLDPLPVGRLWGVGAKGEQRLHALGLRTIGQVAALPEDVLAGHLGEVGRQLGRLARGLDDRPVVPDEEAQSLSTETTFARDVGDRAALRACLLELVEHLAGRLRRRGVRARTVELKVRTADFHTHTRAQTLDGPTDLTELVWQTTLGLFERRVPDDWLPLRLLGVGASGLVPGGPVQGDLFEGGWRARQQSLDRAVDAIRARFGSDSIRRGPPTK